MYRGLDGLRHDHYRLLQATSIELSIDRTTDPLQVL
jgi:hypothetical protein